MTIPAKAAETCPKCGAKQTSESEFSGPMNYACGSCLHVEMGGDVLFQSDTCRIAELESSLARVTADLDEAVWLICEVGELPEGQQVGGWATVPEWWRRKRFAFLSRLSARTADVTSLQKPNE